MKEIDLDKNKESYFGCGKEFALKGIVVLSFFDIYLDFEFFFNLIANHVFQ